MKELSTKEALELGVSTYHNEMDNGEKRFRLSTQSGSSYILTLSPPESCFFVNVGIRHNIYISANTVLHTVKFGTEETDWNPCPELDEMLKAVEVENYI